MEQTLLHVAMAAYRTNPESKNNAGMKFIESLIKCKFSLFVKDSEGQTPMAYLMVDSVPKQAVVPVVQLAIKHGLDLLSKNG